MTLVKALQTHCMLPHEKLTDLRNQYKLLSKDDIFWFKREFEAVGITIIPAKGEAA
jgi:hypothetical protein